MPHDLSCMCEPCMSARVRPVWRFDRNGEAIIQVFPDGRLVVAGRPAGLDGHQRAALADFVVMYAT